jgi:hypothetical protein
MTLDNLDTLIGFAVVMLGVSLLVTVLTQTVATLLGLRGTNLRWALINLMTAADPNQKTWAEDIANDVLTDPLISDSTLSELVGKSKVGRFVGFLTRKWRLASAIRFEELMRIAEDFRKVGAQAEVKNLFRRVLPNIAHQIEQQGDKLKAAVDKQVIGGETTDLEEEIDQVKKNLRELNEKAKKSLEFWFDRTMDRAAQRFAVQARLWTILFSFLVAFGAQLDSFRLLSELSTNAEMRVQLVVNAGQMQRIAEEVGKVVSPVSGQGQDTNKQLQASLDQAKKQTAGILEVFEKSKLQLIPEPYDPWDAWPWWPGEKFDATHFFGMLATAVLLSLGAPFWFNTLKSLVNLRSLVATKHEEEQKKKQDEEKKDKK